MKIEFVRSGGLAGLRLFVDLETDDMPADKAAELTALVEAARAGLSAAPRSPAGPDQFEYRLTFDSTRWGRESYLAREPQIPDVVRPLIEALTALARRPST